MALDKDTPTAVSAIRVARTGSNEPTWHMGRHSTPDRVSASTAAALNAHPSNPKVTGRARFVPASPSNGPTRASVLAFV